MPHAATRPNRLGTLSPEWRQRLAAGTLLATRKGHLCIANLSADWFEPRIVVNFFPICRTTGPDGYGPRVEPAAWPGDYRASWEIGARIYSLMEGGATKPIDTEFVPVPPPRRRANQVPVEWRDGGWR